MLFGQTYEENFNGAEDIHGASEGGAQVEAEPHSSTELRAQRP